MNWKELGQLFDMILRGIAAVESMAEGIHAVATELKLTREEAARDRRLR